MIFMDRIYFVTSNKRKVNALEKTFSKFNINICQKEIELPEKQSLEVREVAEEKVKYAFDKINAPCIVQDSGFYIESLKGFPGALIRFALDTIDMNGILKLAENDKERNCEFKECFAYMDSTLSQPKLFEQRVKGKLPYAPIGELKNKYWSELFKIFIPEGMEMTLAQMSIEEHFEWDSKTSHNGDLMLANYLLNK